MKEYRYTVNKSIFAKNLNLIARMQIYSDLSFVCIGSFVHLDTNNKNILRILKRNVK